MFTTAQTIGAMVLGVRRETCRLVHIVGVALVVARSEWSTIVLPSGNLPQRPEGSGEYG